MAGSVRWRSRGGVGVAAIAFAMLLGVFVLMTYFIWVKP